MICCALLAALALLGLGEARSAGGPSSKYHLPLISKMVSFSQEHSETVRQSSVFLVGKIGVGTPRQEIDILFDLGSMEMILPSTNSTVNSCDDYHCFNGNASSTFKNTGFGTYERYAAGYDYGIVALDTVQVGDLVVPDQAFMNCYKMDYNQTQINFSFHGIIGLTFRNIGDPIEEFGSPPFLYNAKAEGAIEKLQFAILYSRGSIDGQLTIGGWDESLVSEDQINWIDYQSNNGFWGFSDVSVSVGSGESLGSMETGLLLDTGNPYFLLVDTDLYYALKDLFSQYSQFEDYGSYFQLQEKLFQIDEKLPTLTFDCQGYEVNLKPSQYVATHDDDSVIEPGYGSIMIGLSFSGSAAGGIFLRNFYTIFDMEDTPRMGFVPISEISG